MAWLPHMPRIVLGCVVAWLAATGLPEAAGRAAGLANLPHATEEFPNLEAIKAGALQGDARAQFKLGDYFSGRGDFTNAVSWYRQGAERGDGDAQLSLSSCYANGRGVARDVSAAFHWSKVAARQVAKNTGPTPERLTQLDAVLPEVESAPVSPSGFETSRVEQAPKQPAPQLRLRVQRVRELQATPPKLDLGVRYPVIVTNRERKQ